MNMEQILNEIPVSDGAHAYIRDLNEKLTTLSDTTPAAAYTTHFNQNEEMFIELGSPVVIPRFPIHHDVRNKEPSSLYIASLIPLITGLISILPDVFKGLRYFFNPTEALKPHFYRLYKVENSLYVYLLKIDLLFRHFHGAVIDPGSNDVTPSYSTKHLFIESEIIPLERVEWENDSVRSFVVKQLISNTWIGETGRGYLQHGIWMDDDLTKFFTKLVLPEGRRIYPYYPLFCKYKTICAQPASPSPSFRKMVLPLLHRVIAFIEPEMSSIQSSLKGKTFSESNAVFTAMKKRVPSSWNDVLSSLSVRSYLNSHELKEYTLEY